MKKDKALLEIGKKQVIQLIIEKLRIVFDDVLMIGNSSFDCQVRGVKVAEDLKVKNFFPEVKCKYLPEDKIKKYDSHLLSFSNLNTPHMLELARSH